MIEVRGLTKRYGPAAAVDGLAFSLQPGTVTGFLDPNGSGKSTTMRLIMGLDRPDAGTATIGGRPYRHLAWPLSEVGALLEARACHPGRTARAHLRALAAAGGLPRARVAEVLAMTGLDSVAGRRAGTFSLGMTMLADTTVAELTARGGGSLEEAFLALAGAAAEYRADLREKDPR